MLFLILSMSLWAQDVVIQSEPLSDVEYEQYMMEHPHKKTFINSSSTQKHKEELLNLLKKAQYEFLQGSLDSSKRTFIKIAELRHQTNWRAEEKKTIHYALMRSAQLSSSKEETVHYLKKAVIWGYNMKPDSNLFPPPIIKDYHKIKGDLHEKVWPLPEKANKFSKILIDGKPLPQGQSFVKLPPGTYRFSFLSNKYKSINVTTSIKDLSQVKLSISHLAAGSCDQPLFDSDIHKKSHFALFESNCLLPTDLVLTKGNIDFNKSQPINTKTPKKMKKDNTWVWVGVTALTAVATWAAFESQKGRSGPTEIQPNRDFISNGASRK